MALSYDISLRILLLYLVLDITISNCFLFDTCFAIVGISIFNNIIISVKIIF